MEKPKDLLKFFKLAKSDCANYHFRNGIKHHGCLDNLTCLLHDNNYCQYYHDTVLQYKPYQYLLPEWNDIFPLPGYKPKPIKQEVVKAEDVKPVLFKICSCTRKFKPRNSRQKLCEKCIIENKKKSMKKARRKYKDKKL